MAITGMTFDNQVPTAKGFRGTFMSALTDGIISGCEISYSGLAVTIGQGLINLAGGVFQISGSETVNLANSGAYARIKTKIDLSEAATVSTFNQVSIIADYANSANGFSSLVQEDINTGTGVIYESELCVVSISNGVINGIVRTAKSSSKIQYGDTLPEDAPEGTIFLLKVT